MEAATKNAQTLPSLSGVGEVQPGAVHKLYSQQKKSTLATACHSCGKVGHLMKVCHSKPQKQAYNRQGHKSLTKDDDGLSECSKE